ncbi:MAG: hypothetical protein ACLSTI_06510, partial [Ruminococcus sp.]
LKIPQKSFLLHPPRSADSAFSPAELVSESVSLQKQPYDVQQTAHDRRIVAHAKESHPLFYHNLSVFLITFYEQLEDFAYFPMKPSLLLQENRKKFDSRLRVKFSASQVLAMSPVFEWKDCRFLQLHHSPHLVHSPVRCPLGLKEITLQQLNDTTLLHRRMFLQQMESPAVICC